MKRFTMIGTIFFLIVQPAPKSVIVAGKVDADQAKVNRLAIQDALLGGATYKLPAGEIQLDQALQLGPRHAGATLQGAGPATVLRNAYYAGNGANESVWIRGLGLPYIANSSVSPDGAGYVLDATIAGTSLAWNDAMAQTNLLVEGNVVYAFQYDSYLTQAVPPRKRFAIRSFDSATRRLVLDGPPDAALLSLKWMDGTPIADVAEGDRAVKLLDPATAATFPPGRTVFVTSGPSVANSAVGEHRRVLAADPVTGVVTLDAPVTRAYTLAALARVDTPAMLTIKNVTVAQPVNPQALPCQVDTACDVTFDRCVFQAPGDPGQQPVGLNSCGRVAFRNCTIGGGLSLNASHDCAISGGVVVCVAGEEGSTRCTVTNAIVRLDPRRAGQAFNGVGWGIGSDRLTITKTRIECYGGGQCPLLVEGRGLVLRDVTIAGSQPGTWSYLHSDGGQCVRVTSDAGVSFASGTKWKVADSSAGGWELRAGTTGTMGGCGPMPAVAGWRITP